MRHVVKAKRIRNNAIERYINESSFCYANIGFVDTRMRRRAFFESRLLFEEPQIDIKPGGDDPIEMVDITNIVISPIIEKDSTPIDCHKSSYFISQYTDILKNRPFLRRYSKLFHRDKIAIGFAIQK